MFTHWFKWRQCYWIFLPVGVSYSLMKPVQNLHLLKSYTEFQNVRHWWKDDEILLHKSTLFRKRKGSGHVLQTETSWQSNSGPETRRRKQGVILFYSFLSKEGIESQVSKSYHFRSYCFQMYCFLYFQEWIHDSNLKMLIVNFIIYNSSLDPHYINLAVFVYRVVFSYYIIISPANVSKL